MWIVIKTTVPGKCIFGLWSSFSQMILVFLLGPSGNTISKHTLEAAVRNFEQSYANKVRDS